MSDWNLLRTRTLGTGPFRCLLFLAAAFIGYSVHAQDTSLPKGELRRSVDEHDVNLIGGTLSINELILHIGEQSEGQLQFARSWIGQSAIVLGGWNHSFNYNIALGVPMEWSPYENAMFPHENAIVTLGLRAVEFVDVNGTYIDIAKSGRTLYASGSTLIFVDADGTQVVFGPIFWGTQLLATSLTKPNGEVWQFNYDGNRLSSVTTNRGYQIKFTYQADVLSEPYKYLNLIKVQALNNKVEYCAPVATTCTQAHDWPTAVFNRPPYDQRGDTFTESLQNSAGVDKEFVISKYGPLISRRTGPAGSAIITYNYSAPLGSQPINLPPSSIVDTDGTWTYQYVNDNKNDYLISNDEIVGTKTSPGGSSVTWRYSLTPRSLSSVTNAVGSSENYLYDFSWIQGSNYGYRTGGRLIQVVTPEGALSGGVPASGYTQNDYDTRGNVVRVTRVPKSGSSLTNLVYEAVFPEQCANSKTCNKPITVRDARGNGTDFNYDSSHGGILSVMSSPPAPGAARPLKLISWIQRYAYIKSSSGSLVESSTPIWVKASEIECQTLAGSNPAANCDSSAPIRTTNYEYGANGTAESLLVKGVAVTSAGTTLRTCYRYDIYERRISETRANANLATCP